MNASFNALAAAPTLAEKAADGLLQIGDTVEIVYKDKNLGRVRTKVKVVNLEIDCNGKMLFSSLSGARLLTFKASNKVIHHYRAA